MKRKLNTVIFCNYDAAEYGSLQRYANKRNFNVLNVMFSILGVVIQIRSRLVEAVIVSDAIELFKKYPWLPFFLEDYDIMVYSLSSLFMYRTQQATPPNVVFTYADSKAKGGQQ